HSTTSAIVCDCIVSLLSSRPGAPALRGLGPARPVDADVPGPRARGGAPRRRRREPQRRGPALRIGGVPTPQNPVEVCEGRLTRSQPDECLRSCATSERLDGCSTPSPPPRPIGSAQPPSLAPHATTNHPAY